MAFWNKKNQAELAKQPPAELEQASANDRSASVVEPDLDSDSINDVSDQEQKRSWLGKLKSALHKTNQVLQTDIRDLWKSEGRLVDDELLREFFAIMVKTDMGQSTASKIVDRIGRDFRARKVFMEDVLASAKSEILGAMQQQSTSLRFAESGPTIILVVGVNGAGKTTSIAKLANRFHAQGKRVLLGAGDTFRAAAVEQLRIWSERIGCDIVLGEMGSDPASVAYKAIQKARDENFDICIVDTAGRLQTQVNLMQQLEKIRRIAGKLIPDAPHEVLLVLDATAGQNAISQAKGFTQTAGCTGIILAKLDGTAKGGVVVPILTEFALPVKLVGLGEKLGDLADFDPVEFTNELLSIEERLDKTKIKL